MSNKKGFIFMFRAPFRVLAQLICKRVAVPCLGLMCMPLAYGADPTGSWNYCSTQFIPEDLLTALPPDSDHSAGEGLRATADRVRMEKREIYYFDGDVLLQQADSLLHTDAATFNRSTNKIHAEGVVRFQTDKQLVVGDTADVYIGQDKARLSNVQFWLLGNHLRGSAKSFSVLDRDLMSLEQVQFTSCDKDHESWVLRASNLNLDFAHNEGIARNARVEFMGIPFAYIPYLSLPLVGRKTGFLAPSFGTSLVSGTEIAVPYYLNLAPNRDATITPRFMSKRGVQYVGQYRYLNHNSEGEFNLEYLPNDDVYHDDRIYAAYQHNGNPAPGWRMNVYYRYASDDEYFDDFANTLSASSMTHLERYLALNYQAQYWRADAKIQHFQTLDSTIAAVNRPYQRLPQLQVSTYPYFLPMGFEASASAELVNFTRAEGVTGSRLDVAPLLAWRYHSAAGFFEPAVKLRHTRYELENNHPTTDDRPTRNLSQVSLDSGLYFERNMEINNERVLQTLEPRFFYLYVPYRDQNDLIVDGNGDSKVFDTTLPQFSFAELFRDNRFSGVDRIGDANQMSFSLSSRFFSDSGNELFNASIGQIYYYRDRLVTLPGGTPDMERRSDIAAELRSDWSNKFSAKASVLWNNAENNVRRGSSEFRYQINRNKITYLSYRYERDAIDQADFSFLWPLRPKWKIVGRWYYSFLNDTKLESLAGFEYESCCWSVRIAYRDYISDLADQTRNDSIWIQLELKGLASVGKKVNDAFETGRF